MWRRVLLVVGLVAGLLSVLTAAQCFPRQCLSELNCERFCECQDASRGEVIPCNAFFKCDQSAGVCVDDYSLSCDEICQRFAANDVCGSKACNNEVDCIRELSCSTTNPQTSEVLCSYECELPFTCQADSMTCEETYATEQITLCQQFCPPPAGCEAPGA
jgi:hypothetical protein